MASKKAKHRVEAASAPPAAMELNPAADAAPALPAVIEQPSSSSASLKSLSDFQARVMDAGFQAVADQLDAVSRMLRAGEVSEALALQQEFARAQGERIRTDTAELNELLTRAARETAEAMQASLVTTLREWSKRAA
jgi:hypothetical protein